MPSSLSTGLCASPLRLREQPWAALEGVAEPVCGAIGEVLRGTPAERVLDRLLRAHRGWSAEQRRAAAEAVFGVGLWRRRLWAHVGPEAPPAVLLFSLLHHLAEVPSPLARRLAGLGEHGPAAQEGPGPRTWPEALSVPEWLAEHMRSELGDPEAQAFFAAIAVPGPVCLRVNVARTTREALRARLREEGVETEPTPVSPWGLRVVGPRPNVLGLVSHREGLFEVQDEGSQLLGALVGAEPGDVVLDACAGAGGKTLLLASLMQGQGRVDACDVDRSRLERLRVRAQRSGAHNVRVLEAPPTDTYDRVLVDAPCSELGTLRRGPDLRFRLGPQVLGAHVETQRTVLARAAGRVRPGGRLVYATCTLNRRENERVAGAFEAAHPEFRRVRPGARWLPDSFVREEFFVALPHRHGTDGFFAAVYVRDGGG